MTEPNKVPLALLPTPLHPLPTLSAQLGVDLWIKRDDLTGFAGGGNKARKLEYLMADVLESGADTVVTCGALQSNFIRQLGAACSRYGIACVATVMAMPYDAPSGPPPRGALRSEGGNLLLDDLFGVRLVRLADGDWETLFEALETEAKRLEAEGRHVYRIPIGGSTTLGIYGFYKAAGEISEAFDHIVFASSSGSTHIGLAYGLRHTATQVLGICSDPEPEIAQDFAKSGAAFARAFGLEPLAAEDYRLKFDYVGEGYNAPYNKCQEAIRLMARTEGILLDPIYSGKAFAGLLDLIERKELTGRLLFWHTGGLPSLFAQA